MANNGTTLEIGRQSEQELVGSSKNSRAKKILVWGFVGVIAIVVIVLLSVYLTKGDSNAEPLSPDKPAITLEDFLEGKLHAKGFSAEWANEKEVIYRDSTGRVVLRDVETDTITVLIDTEDRDLIEAVTFSLSYDRKFLLIAKNYRKIFRHSFYANFFIVDLDTKTLTPITVESENDPLLFAQWAPQSNAILFNFRFDLYYKKSPTANPIRLTTDGTAGVLNGVADWVYEEEIFSSNIASWISPDGNYLSYIQFNDVQVRLFDIPVYGVPGDLEWQYTKISQLPYPKVGTANPKVRLFTVNLEDLSAERPVDSVEILPPGRLANEENVIATVAWADKDYLVAVWMNRVQNFAIIQKCLKGTATCPQITQLKSDEGWVELFTQPLFNDDGSTMVIIASQPQGEAGGFRHITLISTNGSESSQALTSGEFVVTELFKWDPLTNRIFYAANLPNASEYKHIFTIKGEQGAQPQCITCSLPNDFGNYWDAEFSKEGSNFVLSNLGPHVPKVYVYKSVENGANVQANLIRVWEENKDFEDTTMRKLVPPIEIVEIPLDNGFSAKVKMQLPTPLDRSGSRKYPMLVDVYAGPDSFQVTTKFDIGWGGYLASNKSYIYARIDGRGSGLRGDKLLHQIYKRLGTVEIQDQISTVKKLVDKFPFIDEERVGIWGWSYGGYASGQVLTQDNGTNHVFQCAASVAPVTDWLLYDSIYTERYMSLPSVDDNLLGYQNAQLDTKFEQFRNRKYLLIHGTRDDNVHFQQAMLLARTLERNDVLFREVTYPDEEHGLVNVRPHLYHTLGKFFDDCFANVRAS